ncbi:MAG: flagellar hook-associated protein FlgK [Lachnospiraceae bacterium]|nr:flagellar hook-associated protein FlgK [Lachnospiraceae bacterium]
MPSQFLGLNTGLSGLNYFQNALNTTSHNISNVNTKGYSRQEVLSSAASPLNIVASYGMMGTGVSATSIERQRNAFYDVKYWKANSTYNKYNVEQDNLKQLQTYINEIGGNSGYTKWIGMLSNALQDVADNPSDYTTRISYTLTADSFTDMINEMAVNFQRTQKNINDEIELAVSEINGLAKQIYELTQQIIGVELSGANANDLRDKRGVCIDKLSEYTTVEVEEHTIMFGAGKDAVESHAEAMSIRINGVILVDEMEYNELMVVPRSELFNQNDVEGLVDIYWKNADGSAGESFRPTQELGKLAGLFDIRDGNNKEGFSGTLVAKTDIPPTAKIELAKPLHVDKLNLPSQGTITINGRDYYYDGWEAAYDADGYMNNFTFLNMTMKDSKGVEITAEIPDGAIGYPGSIGANNSTKGIPYYQAQLNEMVRTFSRYMNELTNHGVDAKGEPGTDMFTALDIYGNDYVLKNTMTGAGILSSTEASYYKLTALNWELNSAWKTQPDKVVVSYAEDIEQGDVEARPIIDKIIFGMTDPSMFTQGTLAQFMQAMTTNMAVDIMKMQVFTDNHDDIRYTIDNQRKSVSGVDQNEEASNLVKFENLYNLSSKVISILNEVYDKLINQTGV